MMMKVGQFGQTEHFVGYIKARPSMLTVGGKYYRYSLFTTLM